MNKSSLLLAAAVAAGVAFQAGATPRNYALELTAEATADCGPLAALTGAADFTLQFWFCPSEWTEGATILSRGDGFKVVMGQPGTLNFSIGRGILTATSAEMAAGRWAQVTLVRSGAEGKVYVNNSEVLSQGMSIVGESAEPLVFGGGYAGRIDEVRIFKTAISADFERFAFNTINKWHPQWDDLLVYYKFDMTGCPEVVDYKYIIDWRSAKDRGLAYEREGQQNNHGLLLDGAKKVEVTDNDRLPYLINAGYTANERFFDRIIPQDQYLLHNEIINLAGYSYNDGTAEEQHPTRHADVTAEWLDGFGDRSGVLAFNGNAVMTRSDLMTSNTTYTFEAWLNLDEWTDGAVLIARENADKTQGISIELGKSKEGTENCVVVRVDGNNWRFPVASIVPGEWHYIAVSSTGNPTSSTNCYSVVLDDAVVAPRARYHDGGTNVAFSGDADCVLFKGFKGKVDNVCVWARSFSTDVLRNHGKGYVVPSITQHSTRENIDGCDALYLFDLSDAPGWDSYSNEEWFRAMRAAYEGYTQPRMIISYRQPSGTLSGGSSIFTNSAARKKFAAMVAEQSKSYDGVELDFEWVYGNDWVNYALLSAEIRAALPPEKSFNVSCHNVTYSYPRAEMDKVSAFTFQQYGPQEVHSSLSHFKSMTDAFVAYGFPKDKIMTSYATTTANGSMGSPIKGVKDGFLPDDTYQLTDADIEYKYFGEERFAFNGPMQVYNRAKYTRDNNLGGIFYWDTG
ncbi:MAG: hypothetical protein K2G30_01285, partial [Muribaculaceae bacterium]|nr:hypothetical protein [Muribaculaceae bacterium]